MAPLRPSRGLPATRFTLALSALLVLGLPARADPIAAESFIASFPIYANGGSGFSGPWRLGGFNAFASGYVPTTESSTASSGSP